MTLRPAHLRPAHLRPAHLRPARLRPLLAACVAAGLLGIVACDDQQDAANVATSSASASSEPASSAAAKSSAIEAPNGTAADPAPEMMGIPDRQDKEQKAYLSEQVVTDVRIASHKGFDRVVFDFEGSGRPGWFAALNAEPAQAGSGFPVVYEGETAIELNIQGTLMPFEKGLPDPELNREGSGNITEVVSTGTFEGSSQFIIGLRKQAPYSVQLLDNPARVVVDIQNAP